MEILIEGMNDKELQIRVGFVREELRGLLSTLTRGDVFAKQSNCGNCADCAKCGNCGHCGDCTCPPPGASIHELEPQR